MERLLQAGGAFFTSKGYLVHLCLLPHRIKMGEVWLFDPKSGTTTKGHSGDKSSVPFFLEEEIVSLHVT